MNAKGWIPWVCLAVIFVSLPLLFFANYQRNAAQADARDLRKQVDQLQSQLDDLNSSSVATLQKENARLRAENQGYSQKLAKANNDLSQLTAAKNKTASDLQQARLALNMQQDHLQQLTDLNQRAQAAAAAKPPPPPAISAEDALTLCVQNLRKIDAAKQAWAVDNNKGPNDVPSGQDLLPYLGNKAPACPAGGNYNIGAMNELPSCSVQGHALPTQ